LFVVTFAYFPIMQWAEVRVIALEFSTSETLAASEGSIGGSE